VPPSPTASPANKWLQLTKQQLQCLRAKLPELEANADNPVKISLVALTVRAKTMTSLAARSWQILIKIAKHLEILVKGVGPVIAALWIGWQYQQSRVDKRVESTLAYVTRYEGDDTLIGKTQRAIDAATVGTPGRDC